VEIRAQLASLESPAFAERLAALKARVSKTKYRSFTYCSGNQNADVTYP